MNRGLHAIEQVVQRALRDEGRVAAAFLYGSVARGEDTPLSDVDLALILSGDIESAERSVLLRRVTLEIGRMVAGRSTDVRLLDELPTAIRGRAVAEGILVFERDPVARVRAEVAARLAYHDFLYFEREGAREGLQSLHRRSPIG